MAYSTHPALPYAAAFFGTTVFGFGINAMLRPQNALTFFEMARPKSAADAKLVDSLMVIYGARDVFMGIATYAALYRGDAFLTGVMLLATGFVAGVDGYVCKFHVGKGEWNHWGYGPITALVGAVLMGVFDKV